MENCYCSEFFIYNAAIRVSNISSILNYKRYDNDYKRYDDDGI